VLRGEQRLAVPTGLVARTASTQKLSSKIDANCNNKRGSGGGPKEDPEAVTLATDDGGALRKAPRHG
jgi:hypothetical protein